MANEVPLTGAVIEVEAADQTRMGLASVRRSLLSLGNLLGSVFGNIGSSLGGAVSEFAKVADAAAKMSARTGMSVEAISELNYVASRSGADMAQVEVAVRRMQLSLGSANVESSAFAQTLRELGLSLGEIQSMRPEDALVALLGALGNVEDATKRTRHAIELFGKSGVSLLPLTTGGAEGLATLRERARQLGVTFSDETAAAAEKFNDSMDDLGDLMSGAGKQMQAALLPALANFVQGLVHGLVWLRTFVSEIVRLDEVIAAVKSIATAVGDALVTMITQPWQVLNQFVDRLRALWDGLTTDSAAAVNDLSTAWSQWIDNAMSRLGVFGTMAQTIWLRIQLGAAMLADWLDENFGGLAANIAQWFTHTADKAQLAWVRIKLGAVITYESIKHFFTVVIPAALNWFFENWRDIFGAMYDFASNVFSNLGRNIVNIFSNLGDLIAGRVSFGQLWQPVFSGMVREVKALNIPEQVTSELEKQLLAERVALEQRLGTAMQEQIAGRRQRINELQQQIAQAGDIIANATAKADEALGKFKGAAEKAKDVAKEVPEAETQMTQRSSPFATISAFAARLLGVPTMQKVEKNTRETATAAKELVRKIDNLVPKFQ